MNRTAPARILAGYGLVLAASLAIPQLAFGETDFSVGLEVGVTSDSNVGVVGVGQSGEGDASYHLGLDVGAKFDLTNDTSFSASYDYSSDQYTDYDVFSQQAHSFRGGLRSRFDDVTLGLTYTYIATLLDDEGFLDMQVISPSASGFISDTVYLRTAYSYYDKDFDFLNGRDANSNIFTVDTFIFFDGYRSFLDLRATVEKEDADTDRFDYDGLAVGAFLDLAVDWFGRKTILELGADYRNRDYTTITPSIGAIRQDDKLEFKVALEVPLAEVSYIRGGYKNVNRTSNLPVADYNEQIVSVLFGFEF